MKSILNRNKVTSLADRLPRFGYQVRYAHFITKTPRQKWLTPLLALPARRPEQVSEKCIGKISRKIKILFVPLQRLIIVSHYK